MPDENVNYFFAKQFAGNSNLEYPEPLNELALNRIHPRSFNVFKGNLVPMSFLGLILLYGFMAKVLGVWVITFITPLVAALGIVVFYFFVRQIFNDKIAFLSAIFLAFLPSYWYYAGRSMNHTVLFVVLLMGALLLGVRGQGSRQSGGQAGVRWGKKFCFHCKYLSIGLLAGGALAVRTAEALWVFLAGIILLVIYRKKVKWQGLILLVLGVLIAFTPIFYYQNATFGHPLLTGYTPLETKVGGGMNLMSPLKINPFKPASNLIRLFFPFGVNLNNAVFHFYQYFINLFWFFFWPALGGLALLLWKRKKMSKKQKVYVGLFTFVTLWLTLNYGSWQFFDNPDTTQFTIGNSYARYFLPIYILALPFASFLILQLHKYVKNKLGPQISVVAVGFILVVIFSQSVQAALFKSQETLVPLTEEIAEYKKRADIILPLTEENSVFLVKRAEKFLFPARKVIFYIPEDVQIKDTVSDLLNADYPVYYYVMNGESPVDFSGWNVELVEVEEVVKGELLYELKRKL